MAILPRSPVLTALHTLYDQHPIDARSGKPESWTRLNQALAQQLSCLIHVGAPFQLDDFQMLAADQRLAFSYWCGDDHGERFYTMAVEATNLSACQAYEHWRRRPPYIWKGKRLHLGGPLWWKEEAVYVTSFAGDGKTITLCSYHQSPVGTHCPVCDVYHQRYARPKILHRYTMTVAQLREADPTRQAAKRPPKKTGAVVTATVPEE